jgi:hypothetical protein
VWESYISFPTPMSFKVLLNNKNVGWWMVNDLCLQCKKYIYIKSQQETGILEV